MARRFTTQHLSIVCHSKNRLPVFTGLRGHTGKRIIFILFFSSWKKRILIRNGICFPQGLNPTNQHQEMKRTTLWAGRQGPFFTFRLSSTWPFALPTHQGILLGNPFIPTVSICYFIFYLFVVLSVCIFTFLYLRWKYIYFYVLLIRFSNYF